MNRNLIVTQLNPSGDSVPVSIDVGPNQVGHILQVQSDLSLAFVPARHSQMIAVTFAELSANAKTADFFAHSIPPKFRLLSAIMDVVIPFTGGGESASTLQLGITIGGSELLNPQNAFVAGTYGLTNGDLGSALAPGNSVQGGFIPSWGSGSGVFLRLTTTTNDTNGLTEGLVNIYIVSEPA
jgi:hypothetical protein